MLYYRENNTIIEGPAEKVYITPPQDSILEQLKKTSNFPLLEASAFVNPAMPSSVVSSELIKQLKLKPNPKKKIILKDGEVEEYVYSLTLRFYGSERKTINIDAIAAEININGCQLVLGKDVCPASSGERNEEKAVYHNIYQ